MVRMSDMRIQLITFHWMVVHRTCASQSMPGTRGLWRAVCCIPWPVLLRSAVGAAIETPFMKPLGAALCVGRCHFVCSFFSFSLGNVQNLFLIAMLCVFFFGGGTCLEWHRKKRPRHVARRKPHAASDLNFVFG